MHRFLLYQCPKNIPMWSWHSKVALNVFLRISTFLVADEHVALITHASNTCDNSWIIIACTISMELHPLLNISKQYDKSF